MQDARAMPRGMAGPAAFRCNCAARRGSLPFKPGVEHPINCANWPRVSSPIGFHPLVGTPGTPPETLRPPYFPLLRRSPLVGWAVHLVDARACPLAYGA